MAVQYLVSQPWIALHHGSEPLSRGAARVAVECMLRGADATYVALAEHVGVPLITLDKAVYQRAPPVARVLTPREWLQQVAAAGYGLVKVKPGKSGSRPRRLSQFDPAATLKRLRRKT